MTPLRRRMLDALVLHGKAKRTQEAYISAVAQLARHYRRSPDLLSGEQIEAYLVHLLRERQLTRSTVNQAGCAINFLFSKVLGHAELPYRAPLPRGPQRLPEILSREEIARLLACACSLKARTALSCAYALGLRVSELCALRLEHIDSAADRMCVRVVQGKGAKDRYVPLPAELLALAGRWRAGLAASGWSRPPGYGPILPLLVGGDRAALELQQRLQSAGLLGVAIRPPTVPAGSSRLRLVVRLGLPPHTLDQLLAALGPGTLPASPASPAPPVTRVVVGASGSSPVPQPPVQLIAMHGWAGDGGHWQAWQPAATSRGWGLQLGERGYGQRPALLPPWPRHGRKGLICHSLGVHLVPPEVLAASEAVVLLASFGRFVPPGAEGRPLRIALAGMAAELQESGDELTSSLRAQQLLQRFLSKVLGPGALAAGFTVPPGPADQPIGPAGRDRLRCDLELLGRLTALPASFPRQVPVLLLEATDDPIVHPAARERLRQELPQARVKLLAGSGHAMADPALIPLVLDWLQDGLT